jgi:hypothetical protein
MSTVIPSAATVQIIVPELHSAASQKPKGFKGQKTRSGQQQQQRRPQQRRASKRTSTQTHSRSPSTQSVSTTSSAHTALDSNRTVSSVSNRRTHSPASSSTSSSASLSYHTERGAGRTPSRFHHVIDTGTSSTTDESSNVFEMLAERIEQSSTSIAPSGDSGIGLDSSAIAALGLDVSGDNDAQCHAEEHDSSTEDFDVLLSSASSSRVSSAGSNSNTKDLYSELESMLQESSQPSSSASPYRTNKTNSKHTTNTTSKANKAKSKSKSTSKIRRKSKLRTRSSASKSRATPDERKSSAGSNSSNTRWITSGKPLSRRSSARLSSMSSIRSSTPSNSSTISLPRIAGTSPVPTETVPIAAWIARSGSAARIRGAAAAAAASVSVSSSSRPQTATTSRSPSIVFSPRLARMRAASPPHSNQHGSSTPIRGTPSRPGTAPWTSQQQRAPATVLSDADHADEMLASLAARTDKILDRQKLAAAELEEYLESLQQRIRDDVLPSMARSDSRLVAGSTCSDSVSTYDNASDVLQPSQSSSRAVSATSEKRPEIPNTVPINETSEQKAERMLREVAILDSEIEEKMRRADEIAAQTQMMLGLNAKNRTKSAGDNKSDAKHQEATDNQIAAQSQTQSPSSPSASASVSASRGRRALALKRHAQSSSPSIRGSSSKQSVSTTAASHATHEEPSLSLQITEKQNAARKAKLAEILARPDEDEKSTIVAGYVPEDSEWSELGEIEQKLASILSSDLASPRSGKLAASKLDTLLPACVAKDKTAAISASASAELWAQVGTNIGISKPPVQDSASTAASLALALNDPDYKEKLDKVLAEARASFKKTRSSLKAQSSATMKADKKTSAVNVAAASPAVTASSKLNARKKRSTGPGTLSIHARADQHETDTIYAEYQRVKQAFSKMESVTIRSPRSVGSSTDPDLQVTDLSDVSDDDDDDDDDDGSGDANANANADVSLSHELAELQAQLQSNNKGTLSAKSASYNLNRLQNRLKSHLKTLGGSES